jgi:signal transduction histidine kinase
MLPLESGNLFRDLPPAELDQARKAARELSFAPSQTIFKEGDPGDGIYIVKTGSVILNKILSHGGSCPISRAVEGGLFGEMALLDDTPRSLEAVASGKAAVYFIARPDLMDLLARAPRFADAILRETARRIRDFNEACARELLDAERLSLVGRFASSLAHDLKNPLNNIGISADMASMPSATAESRLLSKTRIRTQIERISDMVNELLEFTQESHAGFVPARMDYRDFVLPLIQSFQQEAAHKSVTIECVNQPPPAFVRINPQRIARVFQHLIANAADAMPGGGAIRLSFSVNSEPSVVTELRDSGKGIPPQMMDRLFQAFATSGNANGAGLGLPVCKKIIHDHKGTVFARNAPDGGAIFGFTLPILNEHSR